ncbi:hypothetical protein JCM8547_007606 [Rhodosporidiobolus lusitaniae]
MYEPVYRTTPSFYCEAIQIQLIGHAPPFTLDILRLSPDLAADPDYQAHVANQSEPLLHLGTYTGEQTLEWRPDEIELGTNITARITDREGRTRPIDGKARGPESSSSFDGWDRVSYVGLGFAICLFALILLVAITAITSPKMRLEEAQDIVAAEAPADDEEEKEHGEGEGKSTSKDPLLAKRANTR